MGFFDNTTNTTDTINKTTTTGPWSPLWPALGGITNQIVGNIPNAQITGNEQAALAGLQANANAGNPFAGGINALAANLLAGGGGPGTGMATNAYNTFVGQISPYATMDTNPYTNPAVTGVTNQLTSDILDRIKSAYAGAGISPVGSGDYGYQVGRGVSAGAAPTLLDAYNNMTNQKLGAINALYGAGNTTTGLLSALNQTQLGNQLQGVQTADQALAANNQPFAQALAVEAARRGIPVQALGALSNLVVPMAQLGGTQNVQGTDVQSKTTPFNFGNFADLFKGGGTGGQMSPAQGMASGLSSALGFLKGIIPGL